MVDLTLGDVVKIVVVGLPVICAAVWVWAKLKEIHRLAIRDEYMHMHPEEFGFGTHHLEQVIAQTARFLDDNARATRELSHYIQVASKAQTGKDLLPYVDSA